MAQRQKKQGNTDTESSTQTHQQEQHVTDGTHANSDFIPTVQKVRAPTVRPLFNDTDSDLEWWLTLWLMEPILHYLIPRSVKPNTLTAINATTCWSLLAVAFIAAHLGKQTDRQLHSLHISYQVSFHLLVLISDCWLLCLFVCRIIFSSRCSGSPLFLCLLSLLLHAA